MKKITYTMELLSSLIVSPRAGQAFYHGINIFQKEPFLDSSADARKGLDAVKVVYPFYQYGEYNTYDPEHAEYYLPGSSVKGALLQKNGKKIRMMADDIPVDRKQIVLRNLVKAQYVDQCDKARFDFFFNNVGVEMLKAGTELCGELYLEDNIRFEEVLGDANRATAEKIRQMSGYLEEFINTESEYNEAFRSDVSAMLKELCLLEKRKDIILVGGYKGLLHSILLKNQRGQKKKENRMPGKGVFLDREKSLPHGLVSIRCESIVSICYPGTESLRT